MRLLAFFAAEIPPWILESKTIQPEKTQAAPAPSETPLANGTPPAPTPPQAPLVLDLKTVLATAVTQSRTFKTQKESLYLQGLGFTLTRYNYGPQFSSSVNYVWGDAKHVE